MVIGRVWHNEVYETKEKSMTKKFKETKEKKEGKQKNSYKWYRISIPFNINETEGEKIC